MKKLLDALAATDSKAALETIRRDVITAVESTNREWNTELHVSLSNVESAIRVVYNPEQREISVKDSAASVDPADHPDHTQTQPVQML